MKQWEYMTHTEGVGGSGPLQQWQLEGWGKAGWELMHVHTGHSNMRTFLFKRPKRSTPTKHTKQPSALARAINTLFRHGSK